MVRRARRLTRKSMSEPDAARTLDVDPSNLHKLARRLGLKG